MERLLRRDGFGAGAAAARLCASDRAAPPVVTLAASGNALRVSAASAAAEHEGVRVGQAAADARALCPGLRARPADPPAEAAFLRRLARWAGRYSPLVAMDAPEPATAGDGLAEAVRAQGLSLDVAGVAHLFGGEAALLADLTAALERLGVSARGAIADGKGAAWALARYGPDAAEDRIAAPGRSAEAIRDLPVAALRLPAEAAEGFARLGLRTIGAVTPLPRASVARRFGVKTVSRIDQAIGAEPEPITPTPPRPRFAARLSLPEPIAMEADLRAGLERLLERVCAKLAEARMGARRLRLSLRRVDSETLHLEVGLARPRRDAAFVGELFDREIAAVDAGYGIDALRLEAIVVEPLGETQTHAGPEVSATRARAGETDALAALLSRLGGRIGFEHLLRLRPGDRHPPDAAVVAVSAAHAEAAADWRAAAAARPPRPIERFHPEPVTVLAPGAALRPPKRFRWRGQTLETAFAAGPERIAPEWWLDAPTWRTGVRDYWRLETSRGDRLHLFFTPQEPEPPAPGLETRWRVAGRFL